MRVLLYSHEACLLHENAPGHPERPDRIPATINGVHASGAEVIEVEAPIIDLEALYPIHAASYVKHIHRACASGGMALDQDTGVVAASWEAALRSAGAGLAAIDALRAGEGDAAFIATRPPGHHALHSQAMGFCLFNNIAVAAEAAIAAGDTVAIFDWDVHHGNGTQDHFFDREELVYLSVHQFPFYPGTGWLEETGGAAAKGHTVNIPLAAGSGGDAVRIAVESIAKPVLEEFSPDWVFVSAGFDGHIDDPLAELRFETQDYGWMANQLLAAHPGRVVYFLEGGYDLTAIEESVAASIRGHAGEVFTPSFGVSPPASRRLIGMAADHASKRWSGVQAG